MNDKIARMKELIDLLNKASMLYYQKSTPMMTDYEYDKLYDELVSLEKETNMVFSNSPTINVEPTVSTELEKTTHPYPMLSLSKTKNPDDLVSFIGNKEGLLSWKLDGLTIVLTYENGKLASGVTRGNGIIGEVVTENVKKFKNIPLSINYTGRLVLRGEAIIKYSDFEKMNVDSEYKNPRNLCSGSVRQLDSSVTAERNVNCIIFALIEASSELSNYKDKNFEWLRSLGFETVEYVKVDKNNLKDEVLDYKEKIKTYDIPSDGLVLTFNDIEYGNSLGSTAKYPKHSIAFKWQDETAKTILREVDWMASRTGLINPVAVFDPVELEGTIVSRASLHNISILRELKIGLNDEIEVYKANMIIPQIANNITCSNNLVIPDKCPVCNHKTEIVTNNDITYLYCPNEFCFAKFMKRLSLFVSRNAMNIDGISEAILSRLINENMVKTYADLYNLSIYKDKIINFDGFGEKSYNNLIEAIEKSRKVKLANFIYSLGIPDIGLSRAKLICSKFNNDIDVVSNLSYDKLSEIVGVGDVIAKEWIDTFKNPDFISEYNKIKKEIILIDNVNNKTTLKDKTFVITGSVNNFKNRDELIEYIESLGGKVVKAISNNVDFLINNDITSTSSKNTKAKELGIKIISEDDLLKMSNNKKPIDFL